MAWHACMHATEQAEREGAVSRRVRTQDSTSRRTKEGAAGRGGARPSARPPPARQAHHAADDFLRRFPSNAPADPAMLARSVAVLLSATRTTRQCRRGGSSPPSSAGRTTRQQRCRAGRRRTGRDPRPYRLALTRSSIHAGMVRWAGYTAHGGLAAGERHKDPTQDRGRTRPAAGRPGPAGVEMSCPS